VPRDDVAATIAELLAVPETARLILELTTGDTPVAAAVRTAAQRTSA
jgi:hypothetical protein